MRRYRHALYALPAIALAAACSSSTSTPVAVTTSHATHAAKAAAAKPTPAVVVSDVPAWDQSGDPSCVMHYFQRDGQVVTVFQFSRPGTIHTHVSDSSGNLHPNVTHVDSGPAEFTYPLTLAQAGDDGAIFWPDGAASVMCSIAAGTR